MSSSSGGTSLRDARARYFRDNGIDADGGYAQKWVRIKLGPVPISFPNTAGRRAVLLQHDLHHVATGYDTSLVGEAEIGAWELASGCRRHYVAWILNLGAVVTGLVLAPRRVVRAFRLGRRCTNLYHLGVPAGWAEETVGALRRRLGLATVALAAVLLLTALPAAAQTPPSVAEAARYTGLHAAAHRGDLTELRKLIAARAAVDARDGHGRTPLHVATFARQREAIRTLAGAGAALGLLENDRYDAVTIAAVADDEETLRVLLSLGASATQVTSRYDGTALIAAAHLGHDGVVKQLIAAGAPLDHVNNLHWTALIEAVVLGNGGPRHVETLRALVAAGASTRLTDRQGVTPLALAEARGYREMVRILREAGAPR